MWTVKKNYQRKEESTKYPLCEIKEDTTKHILECKKEQSNFYEQKQMKQKNEKKY